MKICKKTGATAKEIADTSLHLDALMVNSGESSLTYS